MKNPPAFLALALFGAGCAAVGGSQDTVLDPAPRRGLAIHVGELSLDDNDWAPVEEQDAFAFSYDQYIPDAPFGLEVLLLMSDDDATANVPPFGIVEADAELFEIAGGVRKTWEFEGNPARTYLGGGATYIDAEIDVNTSTGSLDDSDSTFGGYVHGGVYAQFAQGFRVGIDYRIVFGTDVEAFGISADADYDLLSFFFGWGF